MNPPLHKEAYIPSPLTGSSPPPLNRRTFGPFDLDNVFPAPPSRSGSSSVSQREDIPAFSSQFDEVDRAIDNLVKSGKLWNAPRRDSMPMMMGRPYPDYDPRMGGGPQRHHSISEFDGNRMPPSGNAQGFYASQRYQGRPNEVEQMMQAKRRMAAQRERELRNYHQEQQYNRSLLAEMSASKSDRSTSPAAVSEDSRRELLARQHRALYGNESPAFFPPGAFSDENQRPDSQAGGGTPSSGVRGSSPRGMDPFGLTQAGTTSTDAAGLQSPSRANSTSSPSSAINASFGAEQPVTSTSSPGADSPSSRQAASKPVAGPIGSVGPIGSRPAPGQTSAPPVNQALNKRSITPLPSPLGLGFTPADPTAGPVTERTSSAGPTPAVTSAAGAPGAKDQAGGVGLGWSNSSGVWSSKSGLGVQASVWG
ncbi:Herpes virus major outer envelope glycoprotein BLLF1 [Penicillium digitatum]|uniref:Herpes virus major outer envelope glycoprotein BLLF1 n=1 Tax=Penicillium digitatum TaxID=36651 RepID=A0A7T6XL70_PENDI|nr:Herpes virus major outer envelope glycoprotein BLLF1 [Penicillium digitatum]